MKAEVIPQIMTIVQTERAFGVPFEGSFAVSALGTFSRVPAMSISQCGNALAAR